MYEEFCSEYPKNKFMTETNVGLEETCLGKRLKLTV